MKPATRVGFVGNRYGTLSFRIFQGVAASADALGIELVLIDSSSARESRWRTRVRNLLVRTAKRVLAVGASTDALDWYRWRGARACIQRTPPAHRLDAPGFAGSLAAQGVGAVLVAGCDQILREEFLEQVPRVVNFHNSLLPAYRGVNAVEWAFLRRERVSGYTFHTIESRQIDLGRVVYQQALPISPEDTPASYTHRLLEDAAGACSTVLETLTGPAWPPAGPPLEGGSYFGRKDMIAVRRFDPFLSAEELIRRQRVLGSLEIETGSRRIQVSGFEPENRRFASEPGTWRLDGTGIAVACREGALRVTRIAHLPAAVLSFLLPRRIPPVERSSRRPPA